MCDTFIALPPVTKYGNVLMGKNSDREPDEAQAILRIPRIRPTEKNLRCTYIEIPQVRETQACILSKPFQMWGAEMGVNESGVAIGNEAVFTRSKHLKRNDGLTGMDLLRLGLERSTSASEAVTCMTNLLESHGQDACGGYRNKNFFYDNSFIISDTREAYVLETAGREWVTQRVTDIRSISNRLSIVEGDQYSKGAMSNAKQRRWWDGRSAFDFQKSYADRLYGWLGRAGARAACTAEACASQRGQLSAGDFMQILESHNLPPDRFTPRKANTGSICMHRTSLLNPRETTGSMVAELRSDGRHTVWLTGTPHPCLSIYVPFFFDSDALDIVRQPTGEPDNSLWWKADMLHRAIFRDYLRNRAEINGERRELQMDFIRKEHSLLTSNAIQTQLDALSRECLLLTQQALERWLAKFLDR